DLLNAAQSGLDRLYTALSGAEKLLEELPESTPLNAEQQAGMDHFAPQVEAFLSAMDDDFNTPKALAALFEIAKGVNRAVGVGGASVRHELQEGALALRGLGSTLGLLEGSPEDWLHGTPSDGESQGPSAQEIETLIEARQQARNNRDFAESDRIRDALTAQGITLQDGPEGTVWRRSS
ncbi:MAG: cysteine--tRNA ligase, partial [Magnetococcales bacterium]|nr:cysteine--tRNA ligase [Magnetococcales bacterium]